MTLRRTIAALLFVAPLVAPAVVRAQPCTAVGCERGAAAVGALIDGLGTSARVLMIGAHPDDEESALLTFLARGRHARAAYLSLTRGEGGTNLLGAESGEALGVLRTAEALAAHRADGVELYYARAYDFGLSKSAAESMARWGAKEGPDAVLADVVTIVRAFRPHVIVSVYEGTPRDGHGNHQAAGRIARAAFAAAADSTGFDLTYGRPWRATTLYRLARADDADSVVRVNVGEYAPALGRTYAELAAEGRAWHRTQGGALPGALGTSWVALRLLDGASPDGGKACTERGECERRFFDGVDTTLARVRPAAPEALGATMDSLAPAIAAVRAAYRPDDPRTAVEPLAALVNLAARAAGMAGATRRGGGAYDGDLARSLEDVWRSARDALVLASGVAVEATADRETVARSTPNDSTDSVTVSVAVYARGRAPVRVEVVSPTTPRMGARNERIAPRALVPPDSVWRGTLVMRPAFVTQAWWRAGGRLGDLYASTVDGRTEREWQESAQAGALLVRVFANVAGVDVGLVAPVTYRASEPSRVAERPVAVVPGVTIRFDRAAEYARAGVPLARPVRLTLQSSYATARDVTVTLELPPGLRTDSATRTVTLPAGATGVLAYVVRGTPRPARFRLVARAVVGADTLSEGMGTLAYDHLAPQRVYFPALAALQAVPVTLPPNAYVGYVAGPGDATPLALSQLGLQVTQIDPAGLALPSAALSRFSAIVIGPRAYEASPALLAANERLFAFAQAGGTVVVLGGQYLMEQPGVLPFPIALARPPLVVTEESSPVRLADAAAPSLLAPNRITADDFADWAQDRATFVPASFDPRWRAPLEVGDTGEPPTRGALLVAPLGRGAYVYTTLSLTRQIGNANPGAARLLVNLLARRR